MTGILNIQMNPVSGNKELNLKKVEYLIEKQAGRSLDLVVLPEFFSTGIDYDSFINQPEDEFGGETIGFIKELAKKYNTNIAAGTVIEKSGGKLYNTCFVVNRNGAIAGKYRKIHLFSYLGGTEHERITAGNEEIVISLDFAKIGMGICFDIRYPLHFNKLIKKGAEIIILPTAWIIPPELYNNPTTRKTACDMWISMHKTRAYDNMVYFISSNQTGLVDKSKGGAIGTSLIVSPSSGIIANAKDEECAVFAEIDLDLVKYYKQIFPIAKID